MSEHPHPKATGFAQRPGSPHPREELRGVSTIEGYSRRSRPASESMEGVARGLLASELGTVDPRAVQHLDAGPWPLGAVPRSRGSLVAIRLRMRVLRLAPLSPGPEGTCRFLRAARSKLLVLVRG